MHIHYVGRGMYRYPYIYHNIIIHTSITLKYYIKAVIEDTESSCIV